MSKVFRTVAKVATVVAAVASIAVTAGATLPLIAGASIAGVATAVGAVAGALGAATAKRPNAVGTSNQFTIDPQAGIPYAIGRTFVGGKIAHVDGYGGADNPYRSYVMVFSGGGPCHEIETILIDRVPTTFSAGAATGYYSGFMWLSTQLGAAPEATALAAPFAGFPAWSASHKLSGYAAGLWTLKFDKKGKKYASGQPEFGAVGKWARVYDPRLDSTFPGGSGPCRALQESTYVWSENGPLHGLTWALGRWQNGKRVLGVGVEPQDIDIQAFVDAANVFDANGWKVGGLLDGSGDKWNILRTILWSGAAEPLDLGGLLSCRFDSPKVSLATITSDDLADGDITVPAMKTWRDRPNIIIPRFRSEDHNWEIIPASPVKSTTAIAEDGEERTRESEYYCCQSLSQAAQLAAYEIARGREIDGISLPLKTRFIGYKPGDCLTINIPEANLINQLVVVVTSSLDPETAIVRMTFRTETTDKHAWALGRTSSAPPSPSITSSAVMDALIWNNRAGIPEERFNAATVYDFGRVVNLANGARYIYINDTATAGSTPPNASFWAQLSPPTDPAAMDAATTILNSTIAISGGNIQGIGAGDGTTVANNAIQLNADGTISYFNGTSWINLGAVTIPGMGGGALAFLNAVNPATGQVLSAGSVPPSIPDNSFSYTSIMSSITITWPALTIYRADGTTVAISSGSQEITGLSSATTYKVYPYVVDSGGTSGSISFVTGGSGSPSAAFPSAGSAAAAATMYGRGNIPMGSFLAATVSSGSGGGGGGGSGWCLHPDSLVPTTAGLVRADALKPSIRLATPDGWVPIVSIQRKRASQWIGLHCNGQDQPSLIVTPTHVLYRADGTHVAAKDVILGDLLSTAGDHAEVTRMDLISDVVDMVIIELPEPHLYYAGPDKLLSHNAIQKP